VHERRDVNIRAILIGIGVMMGAIALVMVVAMLVFNVMEGRAEKKDAEISPVADTNAYPPAPRLQPSPPTNSTEAQDLAALRAHEDTVLTTYGWVDKPNGVARIPIDSAIEIVAREGAHVDLFASRSMAPLDTVGAHRGVEGSGAMIAPGAALEKGSGTAGKGNK
jgi:hypothetical protein